MKINSDNGHDKSQLKIKDTMQEELKILIVDLAHESSLSSLYDEAAFSF